MGTLQDYKIIKKANLDRENYTYIQKLLAYLRNISQFPFHPYPTFTVNDKLSDFKAEFL